MEGLDLENILDDEQISQLFSDDTEKPTDTENGEKPAEEESEIDTEDLFGGENNVVESGGFRQRYPLVGVETARIDAYLKRGGTLGELLAMSLTKMREIILRHQPGSRIVIWNDMFSPLMNATRPFHLNPEPFGTKGIEKLPKDIVVADWHCGRLEEDMGYFTGRGFKTVGALFYDAKDLAGNVRVYGAGPDLGCYEWVPKVGLMLLLR